MRRGLIFWNDMGSQELFILFARKHDELRSLVIFWDYGEYGHNALITTAYKKSRESNMYVNLCSQKKWERRSLGRSFPFAPLFSFGEIRVGELDG